MLHMHQTVHSVHQTVYSAHQTVYSVHQTAYSVHQTVYSVHQTVYSVHQTVYSAHQTVYSAHQTVYSVHQTPYSVVLVCSCVCDILQILHMVIVFSAVLCCVEFLICLWNCHPFHKIHTYYFAPARSQRLTTS